jgi:A/G-specific adenine glycosylase
VRRVDARVFAGAADAGGTPTVGERESALARVPPVEPGRYSVAVMELGALVCTARAPRCDSCPIAGLEGGDACRWLAAGRPAATTPRRTQTYAGTDRQARGRLLAVLRDATEPVPGAAFDVVWADPRQRMRALDGLVADGLVEPLADGRYRLPA